jgi:cell division protein FtsB
MSLAFEVRRRARFAIVPLLCTGVLAYFGYHAVQGDRGMNAWLSLSQQIDRTQNQLALNRAELDRLEKRVTLLRANGLSRDMLDERARDVLGIAHPDDVVILGK